MDWQILQMVHRLGAIPQHRLAELTGRQRSTVNGAVQRLQASGWLVQAGQTGEGRGRPAILLAVNPDLGRFAGIDIRADDIHVAAVNADGAMLDQVTARLGPCPALREALDQIDVILRGLLSRVGSTPKQLLGIWAGVNGVVDDNGVVVSCASLGWHNEPLREALAESYGCDVLVQAGADVLNAAAESLMGAGRDADSLVYFHVGRGISARLVRRGQPLTGATKRAGELGHVVIEPDGPKCSCGNHGCLEAIASGPVLANAIRDTPTADLPSELQSLLGSKPDSGPRAILAAAFESVDAAGNGALSPLLDRVSNSLALGAAMAVAAYDPDVLVLGGYVFESCAALVEGVQRSLKSMVLDWNERGIRVVRSEVMSQNRAVAGAAEACQRFWGGARGTPRSE